MAEIGHSPEQSVNASPAEHSVDTVPSQSASPVIKESEAKPKSGSWVDGLRNIITFGASETKRITDVRERLNPFSTKPPESEKPANK